VLHAPTGQSSPQQAAGHRGWTFVKLDCRVSCKLMSGLERRTKRSSSNFLDDFEAIALSPAPSSEAR
jgi:hypothetical protein